MGPSIYAGMLVIQVPLDVLAAAAAVLETVVEVVGQKGGCSCARMGGHRSKTALPLTVLAWDRSTPRAVSELLHSKAAAPAKNVGRRVLALCPVQDWSS